MQTMAEKETVAVRLPGDTLQRVEQYADDHGLSKSDALRRMIEKGVDLEEAGLTVAAASSKDTQDGGTGNRLYHSAVQATDYLVNGGFALLMGVTILWAVGFLGFIQLTTFQIAFLMLMSIFAFLSMIAGIVLLVLAEAVGILADWIDHDRTLPDLRRWVVNS